MRTLTAPLWRLRGSTNRRPSLDRRASSRRRIAGATKSRLLKTLGICAPLGHMIRRLVATTAVVVVACAAFSASSSARALRSDAAIDTYAYMLASLDAGYHLPKNSPRMAAYRLALGRLQPPRCRESAP